MPPPPPSTSLGMTGTTPTSSASAQAQVYAQKQAMMRAQQAQAQAQGQSHTQETSMTKTQPVAIPGQMRRRESQTQVGMSPSSATGASAMSSSMTGGSSMTGASAMHAHMAMRGRSGSFSQAGPGVSPVESRMSGIGMGLPSVMQVKRKPSLMRGVSEPVVVGDSSGGVMRERRGSVSLGSPLVNVQTQQEDDGEVMTQEETQQQEQRVEKKPSTMQMLQRKASSMLGRKGSMMLQRKSSTLSVSHSATSTAASAPVVVAPTPSLPPPAPSASYTPISSLKPKPSILALSSNPSGRKMKQVRNLGDLRSLLSGCAMGGKAAQMRRWRCCNSKGGCGREVVGGWGVYGEVGFVFVFFFLSFGRRIYALFFSFYVYLFDFLNLPMLIQHPTDH